METMLRRCKLSPPAHAHKQIAAYMHMSLKQPASIDTDRLKPFVSQASVQLENASL